MMDYSKQRFGRLFKDSYPHMYRMAFSIVEDADDAKDAVHQVFTLLWKGKPQISDNSVRGYLLAATRNQCLHILRQRELRRQMEEELQKEAEECSNEEHDEEMTYQETATVLGISTSTVNKHITRSLEKIRRTLRIAK